MDPIQNRYWPFDVAPPEQQTEQARRQIGFLETAYEAGYTPYMFGSENFGATAERRGGIILYRGCQGKHWQVLLGTSEQTLVSAHVNDFDPAAEAVLLWLKGADGSQIIDRLRGQLFITRETSPGFTLHGE